jgi:YD repeat-containing protein
MLRRFFDSGDVGNGAWSWLPFELVVRESAATLLDRQADRRTHYRRSASGSWDLVQPLGGTGPSLRGTETGGFEVGFANDFAVGFDDRRELIWTGPAGASADRVHFQHLAGRPVRIKRESLEITLQYDERGRVKVTTSSAGDSITYRYSRGPNGRLETVEGLPEGSISYVYDDRGRVTAAGTESTSGPVFTTRYDDRGRLIEHRTQGQLWRFEYASLPSEALRVRIHDQAGETTTLFFDAARRLTAYGPAASRMTMLRYDRAGRIVQLARAKLDLSSDPLAPPQFEVVKILTPL